MPHKQTDRHSLTLAGLAMRIGTVLSVGVYVSGQRPQQWQCTFNDSTLRFVPSDGQIRLGVPIGYGATLEEAMRDFAGRLAGGILQRRRDRSGRSEWYVPQTLRAFGRA